jgi:hypothetical protein
MTHVLTYFDEVPLPEAMTEDDLSTGIVDSGLVDSIGSAYNYFGATQRYPRRQQISHKGLYEGEVGYRVVDNGDERVVSGGDYRVTAPSKLADLHGKVTDLKSKIGVWGQLWRKRLADDVLTWKRARLLHVEQVGTIDEADAVSEVGSLFETLDVGWRSAAAITTSVSATAIVPHALIVPNAGSIPISDAILRVARTSGTITQVSITGTGIDIAWSGSIGASQTLVIDAGQQTALIDSTDQYSGLTFNAGHAGLEWLPLTVGTNILLVTVTGGNATVSIEHYNQWP